MAKDYINRSKFPAMITYIIAVFSLLVGLTLPLGTRTLAEGIQFANMPLLQITGALFALGILGDIPFGATLTPAYSFEISLFGTRTNIGAILLLAYILVTVLALILLIPVCLANRSKPFARRLAMVSEIIALTVLFAMTALEFAKYSSDWNLSVIIPFGITLLMLIIQSIIYFKGSAVIKTVLLAISAIAVFAALSNIAVVLPALANLKMQGTRPFETAIGMYSLGGTTYFGNALILGLSPLIPSGNPAYAVVNVIALSLSILVCINFLLDMYALVMRTGKFMVTFNLIRYIVEFVLILVLYGAIWAMGNFGLCLYLLTILALIQLIIAIVRCACRKKAKAQVHKKFNEKLERNADIADSDEDYVFDPIAKKAAVTSDITPAVTPVVTSDVSPAAAPNITPAVTPDVLPAAAESTAVYNVNTAYDSPTDNFIQKLSDEQKVEFVKIFLDKNSGNISGIPNYVIGGDNSKFFSHVFIFLARVRDLVSDGLMNKLYEEVNLI